MVQYVVLYSLVVKVVVAPSVTINTVETAELFPGAKNLRRNGSSFRINRKTGIERSNMNTRATTVIGLILAILAVSSICYADPSGYPGFGEMGGSSSHDSCQVLVGEVIIITFLIIGFFPWSILVAIVVAIGALTFHLTPESWHDVMIGGAMAILTITALIYKLWEFFLWLRSCPEWEIWKRRK